MTNKETLNKSQIETYCELGVINLDTDERSIHQSFKGDDAYDHFVLALYFKTILQFNKLKEQECVDLEEIPRKEKVLFLYELFNYFNFDLTYFEIGTTLFEFIDGIELMDKLCSQNINRRSSIRYRGVEISELLKQAAIRLHPSHDIKHFNSIEDAQDIDLFYDRIVSSYCFKNSQELATIMNKAKVSFVNLFLSKTMTFDLINDVGKVQTYFSLSSLISQLSKPLYYLFGRENETNIQGFFLSCEEKDLNQIIERFRSNTYLAEFMKIKNVHFVNAKELVEQAAKGVGGLSTKHIREPYEIRHRDYEMALANCAAKKI